MGAGGDGDGRLPSSLAPPRRRGLALLGGALATPSATAGGGCRDRGKTIVANERARVYELRDGEGSVFGCSYRSPRRRVDLDIRSATNGTSRFALAGETVGLVATGGGCSRGACVGTYVESRSLRTGRRSTGTAVLAAAVDPGSLALGGSRLYWTEGGEPRTAPLR